MADATQPQPQSQTTALQLSSDSVSKITGSGSGHYAYGWLTISWDYTLSQPAFNVSVALWGYTLQQVTLNSGKLTDTIGGTLDSVTAEVTLTMNIGTSSVAYQALVKVGSDVLYQKSGTIVL